MLRHLVHDPTVSAADLRAAYSSWEYGLVTAALGAGLAPSDVVTATAPERERSAQAAAAGAAALRAGDPDRAARLLLNAIGEDPWNGAARLDLEIALQQAASLPAPGAAPMLATGTRVTLAAAADLLAALVEELGLDSHGSHDIVAQPAPATQPAQRLLAARATVTLGAPALAVAA